MSPKQESRNEPVTKEVRKKRNRAKVHSLFMPHKNAALGPLAVPETCLTWNYPLSYQIQWEGKDESEGVILLVIENKRHREKKQGYCEESGSRNGNQGRVEVAR
jgi:hypothetical protein